MFMSLGTVPGHYQEFKYRVHMIKPTEVTDCGLLTFLSLLTQHVPQYLTFGEGLIQLYNFLLAE